MSRFGTKIGALVAAGAAALALAGASPAAAVSYVSLISNSMVTTYTATFSNAGILNGTYYSNGISFKAQASDAFGVTSGPIYDLFGFCVDVYHEIDLGNMGLTSTTGDVYQSTLTGPVPPVGYNPLPTDFKTYTGTEAYGTAAYTTAGNTLSSAQLTAITGLVNTGLWLHENEAMLGLADTRMRLAAIQAAIWNVEVGAGTTANMTITVNGPAQYQTYFNNYSNGIYGTGNYANKADANDSFYVISDWQQGGANEPLNSARSGAAGINQAFAIGWPVPSVPEPSSWALMIMGFGSVGAVLRRRRTAVLA
jgi:hypothetical protein